MKVFAGRAESEVHDEKTLEAALRMRDRCGGAYLWLADDVRSFPCMGIRISGDLADVHYLPRDGHPGFRCLSRDVRSSSPGVSTFVYDGCDPATGEEVPNEFVVPFSTALAVANEFLSNRQLPGSGEWLEL